MAKAQPVLIAGSWRDSDAASTFNPVNPKTELPTGETYPVSSLAETEEVITAAAAASPSAGPRPRLRRPPAAAGQEEEEERRVGLLRCPG